MVHDQETMNAPDLSTMSVHMVSIQARKSFPEVQTSIKPLAIRLRKPFKFTITPLEGKFLFIITNLATCAIGDINLFPQQSGSKQSLL
jgi:hypothetical protein